MGSSIPINQNQLKLIDFASLFKGKNTRNQIEFEYFIFLGLQRDNFSLYFFSGFFIC